MAELVDKNGNASRIATMRDLENLDPPGTGNATPITGKAGEHIAVTVTEEAGVQSVAAVFTPPMIAMLDHFKESIDSLKASIGQAPAPAGTLGDLAVGDVVYAYMQGLYRPWRVWRHDAPSGDYAGYPAGTVFLLSAMSLETRVWDPVSAMVDYENSEVHQFLNNEFFELFPKWLQDQMVQGRVPYRQGNTGTAVSAGAAGLLTKVFLPSATELGLPAASLTGFGADFGAFTTDADRIHRNALGTPVGYWTRIPALATGAGIRIISVSGIATVGNANQNGLAIRPVIALPPTVAYDGKSILIDPKG